MEAILPIHSTADVITNSSTVIYTWANSNAVEKAYELLNEVLKMGGSTTKAEDIFDISVSYDDEDAIGDWLEDEDNSEAVIAAIGECPDGKWNDPAVKEYRDKEDEYVRTHADLTNYTDYNGNPMESSLVIKPKDTATHGDINIFAKFFNLFHQEAYRDG
jgi:hypothetical protein